MFRRTWAPNKTSCALELCRLPCGPESRASWQSAAPMAAGYWIGVYETGDYLVSTPWKKLACILEGYVTLIDWTATSCAEITEPLMAAVFCGTGPFRSVAWKPLFFVLPPPISRCRSAVWETLWALFPHSMVDSYEGLGYPHTTSSMPQERPLWAFSKQTTGKVARRKSRRMKKRLMSLLFFRGLRLVAHRSPSLDRHRE